MKRKRRYRRVDDLYARTAPIDNARTDPVDKSEKSVDFEEESLNHFFEEIECPSLSPPTSHTVEIPSNSIIAASPPENSCSSPEMSSTLSPSAEREVCEMQEKIEEEVSSIARDIGMTLEDEEPHALGEWVHAESSNLETLQHIWNDLRQQKENSEWFQDAADAWALKFIAPSPAEEFYINSQLLDFNFSLYLCPLLLVLIFLLYTMFVWWRDVLRESTLEGHHTKVVQLGLRQMLFAAILSICASSSKKILIYNEEMIVAACFIGFIIFSRKSLGKTFKVTLDGRIQAIQEESQQFLNPNEVVPPESNEQQRLLRISLRICGTVVESLPMARCAPKCEKTVQALLCRNLNVKSATLQNAISSRRIRLQDDLVTGFHFSVSERFEPRCTLKASIVELIREGLVVLRMVSHYDK
nr:ATPase subunit 4 [Gentiana crassicaulis]